MLIRYSDSCDAITNFVSLTVIPKSCRWPIVHCVDGAIFTYEERGKEYMNGVELPLTSSTVGTYTGSCWRPNTVMYESFTSIYGFGGRYRLKGKVCSASLRVSSRYLYVWNISFIEYNTMSGTWKEKKKEVHHEWILTIQVSFVVKNISVPVV